MVVLGPVARFSRSAGAGLLLDIFSLPLSRIHYACIGLLGACSQKGLSRSDGRKKTLRQGADVRPFSQCNFGSGVQPSYARMNERAHTLKHAHNTSKYNRCSLPLDQLSGGWRLVKQWSSPNMQLGSLVKSLLCAIVLAAIDFPPSYSCSWSPFDPFQDPFEV